MKPHYIIYRFLLLCFCIFITISTVQAGALNKSLKAALAKKFGSQSTHHAVKKIRLKQPAQKFTSAEKTALKRIHLQLDKKTLKTLERKYGKYISLERMALAKKTNTKFKDHAYYQQYLQKTYPNLSKAERDSIVGDFKGVPHVNQNQITLPRIVAHERIHQLASPRFKAQAGSQLNEGMTEYFAGKVYSDLSLRNMPKVYPQQQRVVEMMAAHVGEKRLAQAFFSGETSLLRRELNDRVGQGTFDKITRAVQRNDILSAEKILKGG